MLVQCWIVVVAVVLALVPVLLMGASGLAVALAAMLAVEAAWQWLAFRWIERHGGWHSVFD